MKKLCRLCTAALTSLLVLLCAGTVVFTASAEEDYFILGDVTGDEVITQADADTMLDGVAGRIQFTQKQKYAADVTFDSIVDMQDVYTLLKYIAGKSHNAYIGKKFYMQDIQSVKLNKTNITLNVSESDNLSVITTPYYDNVTVRWYSSDSNVASVSTDGKIEAKGAGRATITAETYNGKTAACEVNVKAGEETVTVSSASVTLGVGEGYTIEGFVNGKASSSKINWTSSNNAVAKVENNGSSAVIKANNKGTATVTAQLPNGSSAACKVTVKSAPSSVAITPSRLTLGAGESYTISQSTNSGSYAKGFTWSSSNTSVATVTKTTANKAKITAKGVGTATVKVKLYNGKTSTCKVTVKKAPSSVAITPSCLTLGAGESYTISQSTNSGSYAKGFTWSSSNKSVATVTKTTANKAKITAKGVGTATVTVKLYNGKTSTCKVTVKKSPSSVAITPSRLTLGAGESYTISQSTNDGSYAKGFTWSSSNKSVATVTKTTANKAKITAKGVGTATVKVRLYNGKTSTCKVTVKKAPSSVAITPSSLTLGAGESYTISQSTNSGSYAKGFTWSSSNKSVATVTKTTANKAKITAKGVGTATVTVKLYNGKTSACKVTVVKTDVAKQMSSFCEYNGQLYYSPYRPKRSGDNTKDSDIVQGNKTIVKLLPASIRKKAGQFVIDRGIIYYAEKAVETDPVKINVHRCNLNGTNDEVICNDYLYGGNYDGGIIYGKYFYYNSWFTRGMVRLDLETMKKTQISEEYPLVSSTLYGDKGYFINTDNNNGRLINGLYEYNFSNDTTRLLAKNISPTHGIYGIYQNYVYCTDDGPNGSPFQGVGRVSISKPNGLERVRIDTLGKSIGINNGYAYFYNTYETDTTGNSIIYYDLNKRSSTPKVLKHKSNWRSYGSLSPSIHELHMFGNYIAYISKINKYDKDVAQYIIDVRTGKEFEVSRFYVPSF